MHNRALRKLALALTFWLALNAARLHAQILPLGPYGTSPITFEVDSNGLLSATGAYGTGSLSLSGAGARMFWYPGKAAFRAGYVSSIQWDDIHIGIYSVALGYNTSATGPNSTAFGTGTSASGAYSTAFGDSNNASGVHSTAFGDHTIASGAYSTAFGQVNTASGAYSTAFGQLNTASGAYSTAMGALSTASGRYSTASGLYALSSSYLSFAIGAYNVGGGNATSWVSTDPLFEIGNGNEGTASNGYTPTRSDAFVVYKNGNATVQGNLTTGGVITAAPGGDIPMYTGN